MPYLSSMYIVLLLPVLSVHNTVIFLGNILVCTVHEYYFFIGVFILFGFSTININIMLTKFFYFVILSSYLFSYQR